MLQPTLRLQNKYLWRTSEGGTALIVEVVIWSYHHPYGITWPNDQKTINGQHLGCGACGPYSKYHVLSMALLIDFSGFLITMMDLILMRTSN